MMRLSEQTKVICVIAALISLVIAVGLTEWRGGHPIGSFAESFVAVALAHVSLIVSALAGIKSKERLDNSAKLYRASTLVGWIAGIACFLACYTALHFIPGISEVLDRWSEESSD